MSFIKLFTLINLFLGKKKKKYRIYGDMSDMYD